MALQKALGRSRDLIMALYHVGLMGAIDHPRVDTLATTLRAAIEPMGIADDLVITGPAMVFDPPADYSSVGVYFGADGVRTDEGHLRRLMARGTPILPVVDDLERFADWIPRDLHPINGQQLAASDPGMERLAASILGTLGLLPRQRRVFCCRALKVDQDFGVLRAEN